LDLAVRAPTIERPSSGDPAPGCRVDGCNVPEALHDYVVVRAGSGQELDESLETLYAERYEGLVRLGYLLTGSRGDGEDLAQTAFASLAQSWDDVRSPRAYLRQAVVNRAADLHRRAGRQLPARPEVLVGEPVVDETWDAVQQLPEAQRTVVVLRFYEDLALVDIAELLRRPESTVRSDLRRALLRLRKELDR
jgi:RNA polymerase sigma factor (sigma-70 family)